MGQIFTTATFFTNGAVEVPAQRKKYLVELRGTWAVGEKTTFTSTMTQSALQVDIGAGDVTGIEPLALLTDDNKMNFVAGTIWYFSAIGQPTVFNDLNAVGNGFIDQAAYFSTPEVLKALAPYQGKIAVFGRTGIPIWQTSADPAAYRREQTLRVEGTFAGQSVQPLGELEIFYLHDSGIRSIRSRETTLSAFPDDIGSPLDVTIVAALQGATEAEREAACSVVNPESKRYWLYLDGNIYVFSSFPTAKVSAWSVYKPTYQQAAVSMELLNQSTTVTFKLYDASGNVTEEHELDNSETVSFSPSYRVAVFNGDTELIASDIPDGFVFRGRIRWDGIALVFTRQQLPFVPQKFAVHDGIVTASASDAFYVYGGSNRSTYDNCAPIVTLPFLDDKKPATIKTSQGVDIAMTGNWDLYGCMDIYSQQYTKAVDNQSEATFGKGRIGFPGVGTHFSLAAYGRGNAASTISSLIFHYIQNNEK